MSLLDADSDVCFYAIHLHQKCKQAHYIRESNDGPIVISVEPTKGKKFQRAIIRTKKVLALAHSQVPSRTHRGLDEIGR